MRVVRRGEEVGPDELVQGQGGLDDLGDAGVELLAEPLGVEVPEEDPAIDINWSHPGIWSQPGNWSHLP